MNRSNAPPNIRTPIDGQLTNIIAIGGHRLADGGHVLPIDGQRLIDDGCVTNELITTV